METKLRSGTWSIAYSSDSTYLTPGRVLHGRYYIENIIATTKSHTIHSGSDLSTGSDIVIKYAHNATCSYGAHGEACTRLVSEGMMLLLLKRKMLPAPHFLAQLHAVSRPYLVMTRIPGQTLASLHQQGHLRPRQILSYVMQLCQHLRAVHQIGYVHHDIKPANIIIGPGDSPVLIDWGAAQRIQAAGDCRPENIGTRGYLSPEQARGEAQPGNDIFALAMTLDELIPEQGRHLEGIIRRATLPFGERYAKTVDFQRALSRLALLDQLVNSLGLSAI